MRLIREYYYHFGESTWLLCDMIDCYCFVLAAQLQSASAVDLSEWVHFAQREAKLHTIAVATTDHALSQPLTPASSGLLC